MKKLSFLLMFFLALALAAPMVGTQSVVARADTLTVLCTPQEDWCVAQTQAFQEETGIETSYVRMSSGESLARIRATKDDPEFSVWWGGPADAFIAAADEGLLEAYEPELASVLPPNIMQPRHSSLTLIPVRPRDRYSMRTSSH